MGKNFSCANRKVAALAIDESDLVCGATDESNLALGGVGDDRLSANNWSDVLLKAGKNNNYVVNDFVIGVDRIMVGDSNNLRDLVITAADNGTLVSDDKGNRVLLAGIDPADFRATIPD